MIPISAPWLKPCEMQMCFYGLSIADILTPEMVKTMAERPLIFAMANPDPEIKYELAKEARPDAIVATGTVGLSQPDQ